jgi:hypothetical protein
MAPYRRQKGQETWHFCSNCSKYPTSDYEEQTLTPSTGDDCRECKAKRAARDCK